MLEYNTTETTQTTLKKRATLRTYKCECCNFEGDKTHYDTHCKTSKHLNNVKQIDNNEQNSSNLYHQLKDKDDEIAVLREELSKERIKIQILEEKLKYAETLISKTSIQQPIIQQPIIQQVKPSVNHEDEQKKFNKEKYLNETCADATCIEDVINSFDDLTKDKFISAFKILPTDKPKCEFHIHFPKYLLKDVFDKEQIYRPIQMTDSKRKHYYVKSRLFVTNGKIDETELDEPRWYDSHKDKETIDLLFTRIFTFERTMMKSAKTFFPNRNKDANCSDSVYYSVTWVTTQPSNDLYEPTINAIISECCVEK
jgi:hypothetical protein